MPSRLTQQNRQEHAEAEREEPKRRGGCASRASEARFARGKTRIEPHPVLMATFEQEENGGCDRAVDEMAEE